MKLLSLFTGAGGLDLGLERAGFTVIEAVERDRDCIETLRRNRPHWPITCADIRRYEPVGEPDVIAAGLPCQGYSVSGRRCAEDPRNQLYQEVLRVTDALRPFIVLIENVPGMRWMKPPSRKHTFMQKITRAFRSLGYSVRSAELDLSYHGVPQRRRRIFIIAALATVPRDIFPSPDEQRACIRTFLYPPHPDATIGRLGWRGSGTYPLDEPAPTVDTGGLAWVIQDERQPLDVAELARLQTFPEEWGFAGRPKSVRAQIGNAVPTLFAERLGRRLYTWIENTRAEETRRGRLGNFGNPILDDVLDVNLE